jgi:hypothetical protein
VWLTGGLAAAIVVFEGAQHLYQLQEHWISYRHTAEASSTSATCIWPGPAPMSGRIGIVLAERIKG